MTSIQITIPSVSTHFKSNAIAQVGKEHPITLPIVDFSLFQKTLGPKIDEGDCSSIYEVQNQKPRRVYKAISQDQFENGDEIRISKIAAKIGVAPAFHGAFLVKEDLKNFVIIEMDYAGESMGTWMEKLYVPPPPKKIEKKELTPKEKEIQEFLEKMRKQFDQFQVTEIEKKERISLEKAISQLYKDPQLFYCEFFTKIKELAEKNIAYSDSHVGNIIPNPNTEKGMQLIDFDGAKLMKNKQAALEKSMKSVYNKIHYKNFVECPDLSQETQKLISWFTKRISGLVSCSDSLHRVY